MSIAGLCSCYDEVGGSVYFARMLANIRLHAKGTLPVDYQANLGRGFDDRCCALLGVAHADLVARVGQDGSDAETLDWCCARGRCPTAEEIAVWNGFMAKRGWRDEATPTLKRRLEEAGLAARTDIQTMFDFIDVDEGRPLRAAVTEPDMFATVGEYVAELCGAADAALEAAIRDSNAAGLPAINVSPTAGKLLYLLAKLRGGAVTQAEPADPSICATREFNRRLASPPLLEWIIVPVIRPHLDRLAIAWVRA